MRLLVSVVDVAEARAALDGGADIIDAKDPSRGALGAVNAITLRAIVRAVSGTRPVSAALGDVASEQEAERLAREAAFERLAYVKLGFAGIAAAGRVRSLVSEAVLGARVAGERTGIVAVAYADARRAETVSPMTVIESAERAGAVGVLLDTAFKDGGTLFDIMDERAVAAWVAEAHAAALTVALAGGLSGADLSAARALGADIAGVRTAACEGGRLGRVSRARVAALAASAGHARRARPLSDWLTPNGGVRITPPAELR
ncbi:MAG TPA: (5-formylfuran-3-yl)methyl phosphate synthase [Gemmatimonadaceae bacterium]